VTKVDDTCLFCRIANRRVPSHVVYESDQVLAFLDINPIRTGHVQVIPRQHFPYFDAVPVEVATEILAVGQKLAPVLRHLFAVERVAFLFTGGDIAHAHAHVVPLVEATDITSRQYIVEANVTFQNAPRVSESQLALTAEAIKLGLTGASPG
jgi:histidine triad (HIT) family protein